MVFSRWAQRMSVCVGLAGLAALAFSGCGGGSSKPVTGGGGGGGSTSTDGLPTGDYSKGYATPFQTPNGYSGRDACRANSHQNGRARWTVLVFMNAASNLQPDSLLNVRQMASVGSNSNLNIVLQWKQTANPRFFGGVTPVNSSGSLLKPSFIGTRRYLIQKHSQADLDKIGPPGVEQNDANASNAAAANADTSVLDPDRLADPATNTLADSGSGTANTADMGKYQTLNEFVKWGAAHYPADHLCVVIWDHGSAALNVDNRSAAHAGVTVARAGSARATRASVARKYPQRTAQRGRSVSQDTNTGSQISTKEIALGLASPPQTIDSLVIDCSLEATTEVAYEVRNSARTLVATEESPPGQGYPYDEWLGYLQTNTAGPCDLGDNIVRKTIALYDTSANAADGVTNLTQSMTDLSKMGNVATAVNNLGGALLPYVTSQATLLNTARDTAQAFEYPDFKDLYDYADLLRVSATVPSSISTAAAAVESSLRGSNGAILLSARGTQLYSNENIAQEAFASGLSIYLPDLNTQGSLATGVVGYDPQYTTVTSFGTAAPNWTTFLQRQAPTQQ